MSLGEYVRDASKLKILRLQWNKIHSKGASFLFENLSQNSSIKNLDISWNMLGAKEPQSEEVMTSLAKMVNAEFLSHLDISYNSIKSKD